MSKPDLFNTSLYLLQWNLSSVQLQSEEEELLPLQKSELTVNSQEIIPASFSDASITLPTNKVCGVLGLSLTKTDLGPYVKYLGQCCIVLIKSRLFFH